MERLQLYEAYKIKCNVHYVYIRGLVHSLEEKV